MSTSSMISTQACILLSAAFAGALDAYAPTARQKGWPTGQLFVQGGVPFFVYLAVAATLLGIVASWAWSGTASWWLLLWAVLASFIGAPIITSFFKSWSAGLSLVAAPIFTLIAVFLH